MTRSVKKFSRNTGPTLPGMEISEISTQAPLQGLISSQGECLASPTVLPENAKPQQMSVTSGPNFTGLFASLSPLGCWLKTCWAYLVQRMVVSSVEYSETWPKHGMMRNGLCYRLPSSGP